MSSSSSTAPSPCRYDWLGIHEEMLRDTVRVNAYRDAILGNKWAFAGKKVLEVGCGTGILSMFAAKAGASIVYAVDAEKSCTDMTRRVAEANGLSGIIVPVHGRIELIDLKDQVDVIMSEWMGYFLLYENMLEAVLSAKERFLVPGGIVFPTVVDLFVAPFSDVAMEAERQRFWSNIGGIDMTSLLPEVVSEFTAEPRIEGMSFDQLLSEPICIWSYDFRETSAPERKCIKAEASWHCPNGATAHGFVGWFDCHFDPRPPRPKNLGGAKVGTLEGHALADCLASAFKNRFSSTASQYLSEEPPLKKVKHADVERAAAPISSTLSTAPGAPRTHWHHTLFYFRKPIPGGRTVKTEFQVNIDDGAKGWLSFWVNQDFGDGQQPESQSWTLRSYANEGLRAPPLPTVRTWLYDLVTARGNGSRKASAASAEFSNSDAVG
eukprot:TRINITY_DN1247_c2_g1_i1.p1 TRINITY_DN1247_c2_g1~~TRINITY_DN1247_c2_g1_i1.p1  ORF type:complete len:436 (+),score=70.36 TRINITY_DN1247_c2_g1_i1:113-1420(+)